MRVPILLITGPVGAGKTAVLGEIASILRDAGARFAAVDMDQLSYCHPSPGDDRFRTKLTFRDLAGLWLNFRSVGAERLVLAYVIESRDLPPRYRAAIPGAEVTIVRLRARVRTLQGRIRRRERGLGRAWHVHRAAELARIMDRERVEDVLVETDSRTLNAIAHEILERTGWLPARTP